MRRKTTAFALVYLLAVALPMQADRRRAVAMKEEPLTLAFVDDAGDASLTPAGSDAWLDLKTVSHPPVTLASVWTA